MDTQQGNSGTEKKTRLWGAMRKPVRPISLLIAMLATVLGVVGLVVSTGSVLATPASGVTPQVLGRATLDPFHIQMPDFKVHSKKETDLIVQQVTFEEGGHTGWHSHPGMPVLLVKEGHIAITLADGCTTEVFGPGEGFVEHPNEVMIARNAGGPGEKAVTIVTFIANPAGVPARTDEADPGCDLGTGSQSNSAFSTTYGVAASPAMAQKSNIQAGAGDFNRYNLAIELLEGEISALLAEARQDPSTNPSQLDRELRRLDYQIDILRLAAMEQH